MIELDHVIVLLVLCLAGFFLFQHGRLRTLAYRSAKQRLTQEGALLLDQTIVLKRMRLRFSKQHLVHLQRVFEFEFATMGDVRYRGQVVLEGRHVSAMRLPAFKVGQEYSSGTPVDRE